MKRVFDERSQIHSNPSVDSPNRRRYQSPESKAVIDTGSQSKQFPRRAVGKVLSKSWGESEQKSRWVLDPHYTLRELS